MWRGFRGRWRDCCRSWLRANFFKGIPGADGGTVSTPVIFTNFVTSAYYWSSTTSAADPSQAWSVYSCDFGVYNLGKAASGYSLAVR